MTGCAAGRRDPDGAETLVDVFFVGSIELYLHLAASDNDRVMLFLIFLSVLIL